MRLVGKNVVVTGSSGIAAAGARLAASHGASVFVVSRVASECEALAASIHSSGGVCSWAVADLTDEIETKRAFLDASEWSPRVDGLFAVAGGSGRGFGDGAVHDVPLDGWNQTIAMNVTPAFLAARETIRIMRDQPVDGTGNRGSIVLVSSVLATSPVSSLFGTHSYAAAKGAINSLGRTMASQYAADGIRVNVVAPGLVSTPMSERAANDPAIVSYIEGKQPLASGFLDPDDIAQTALFLLSDESSRVTGQQIAVDGGWSVTET